MTTHITLQPTTKRHKQLIKEFGSEWVILAGPEPMPCFNNELGLWIKSLNGLHRRNVRVTDVKREWE